MINFLNLNNRVWYSNTNFLKHVREFQSSKSERGLLNFQFYALRLFIFRRGADKRRRSRLLFLRPQNAAAPHFEAVKIKGGCAAFYRPRAEKWKVGAVKLNIKWSARAFGAAKFPQRLNKISIVKTGWNKHLIRFAAICLSREVVSVS